MKHSMRVYAALLLLGLQVVCGGDTVLYSGTSGTIQPGFDNWSWATINLQCTSPVVPNEKYSISVVVANWTAFYIHFNSQIDLSTVKSLDFEVNGGSSGNEPVNIEFVANSKAVGVAVSVSDALGSAIPANSWASVSIPITKFQVPEGTMVDGVWWQANSAANAGTVYYSDIKLTTGTPVPPKAATITVDVSVKRPVSNLIYGVNWASAAQIKKNKYTVNRWGGEAVTRYNYLVDVSNHCSDWFYENLPQAGSGNELPNNSSADLFVRDSLDNGAVPVITLPTIGYTPIGDRTVRCGFSVKKYGAQEKTDQWHPDCGNGMKPDGKTPITGNDPADTSIVINSKFVLQWLAHFDTVFGKGKVFNFEMDNEPGLWHVIHRDVHPKPMTYDELWNKTVAYAGAIKSVYPNSQIFGPIPWGWCEYMFSPADNCAAGADRTAHGGLPMLEWYIQQVGLYKQKHNVQLVDVIDVHVYPTETFSNDEASSAALRFRSTRDFWDQSYANEGWVAQPIYILTRVQQYIKQYLPGAKIAVSEYNWGDDNLITSALAQVMILGIFAENNVYLATRWVVPNSGSFNEYSFQIFTNYDGRGSAVKGDNVNTISSSVAEVEAYAFYESSPSTVYVVLVNKVGTGSLPVAVDVSSAKSTGSVTLYEFSATKPLGAAGTAKVQSGSFTVTMDAWSAVLAVIN